MVVVCPAHHATPLIRPQPGYTDGWTWKERLCFPRHSIPAALCDCYTLPPYPLLLLHLFSRYSSRQCALPDSLTLYGLLIRATLWDEREGRVCAKEPSFPPNPSRSKYSTRLCRYQNANGKTSLICPINQQDASRASNVQAHYISALWTSETAGTFLIYVILRRELPIHSNQSEPISILRHWVYL